MTLGGIQPRPASCEHLFERDGKSSTGLRIGVLAAVAMHLTIFAITWPTIAQQRDVERGPIIVHRFPITTYPDPPPFDQRFEVPPRRVPVPDPDPQGPEPIGEYAEELGSFPDPGDRVPFVPQPPPIPASVQVPALAEVGVDIEAPTVVHRVVPEYPAAAVKVRLQGAVVLSLIIGVDGRVSEVTVLRGLPLGLTKSAEDAVGQWVFQPSTLNGHPVKVRYILTVRFRLE